jgi:hypothetical protein
MQNMMGRKVRMSGSSEDGVFLDWTEEVIQESDQGEWQVRSFTVAIIEFDDGELRVLDLDSFYFVETMEEYYIRLTTIGARIGAREGTKATLAIQKEIMSENDK